MNRTEAALDILCDVTISRREAVERFYRFTRRLKPIDRMFLLHCGSVVRHERERHAFDLRAIGTWSDDGGRA